MEAFASHARARDMTFGEVLTALARVLQKAGRCDARPYRAFQKLFGDPGDFASIAAGACDGMLLTYNVGLLLVLSLCSPTTWTMLERELSVCDLRPVSAKEAQGLYRLLKDLMASPAPSAASFTEALNYAAGWLQGTTA
jgi:hypothetical protein